MKKVNVKKMMSLRIKLQEELKQNIIKGLDVDMITLREIKKEINEVLIKNGYLQI